MNISQEQREACALLEAEIRGGGTVYHRSSGAVYIGVKVDHNSFEYNEKDYLGLATPPDTPEGALEWMRMLSMKVQKFHGGEWYAERDLIPVHPGRGDSPLKAIAMCALKTADAHAKKETEND